MNYAKKKTENLYVILVALLTVVAVVCAIAGAVNRSRKADEGIETTGTMDEVVDTEDADAEGDDKEDVFNEDSFVSSEDVLPNFISPTGGHVVKDYSADTPVFSLTMEDYRTHQGVDVFVELGERVLCAADGTVKEIWEDPMMGTCISVSHSGGAVSVYKNLSPDIPEEIKVGERVYSGQMIAVGGESALVEIAEEPHVHFELLLGGKNVDPREYITFASSETPYEG